MFPSCQELGDRVGAPRRSLTSGQRAAPRSPCLGQRRGGRGGLAAPSPHPAGPPLPPPCGAPRAAATRRPPPGAVGSHGPPGCPPELPFSEGPSCQRARSFSGQRTQGTEEPGVQAAGVMSPAHGHLAELAHAQGRREVMPFRPRRLWFQGVGSAPSQSWCHRRLVASWLCRPRRWGQLSPKECLSAHCASRASTWAAGTTDKGRTAGAPRTECGGCEPCP